MGAVSVPSRGLRYLNTEHLSGKSAVILFPSPHGGLRYLNDIERSKQGYVIVVSVPSRGIKVSELYILCHPRHDILYIVFKGFLVSDTPLIATSYYTINT